jgi:small subunit ribosomal protein S3
MGQKVNPTGIRLKITEKWNSTWYAGNNYAKYLISDLKVREYLQKKLSAAGISRVQIERLAKNARVIISAARPGVILGKKGGDVDVLRGEISKMLGMPTHVSIVEVKKPDLDAKLAAKNIAEQLERRIMFRKAMKRVVQTALKSGALGVKVMVAGRLGGAEIARTEWYREGRVPLHTFRADIDYGVAEANTTYGIIGVKVWIFKGEVFDKKATVQDAANVERIAEAE